MIGQGWTIEKSKYSTFMFYLNLQNTNDSIIVSACSWKNIMFTASQSIKLTVVSICLFFFFSGKQSNTRKNFMLA